MRDVEKKRSRGLWEEPMSHSIAKKCTRFLAAAALVALSGTVLAQDYGTPTNNSPNPYKSVFDWAKMPPGRTWGSSAGVDIDPDGKSVWVIDRCGANSCFGSNLDPILKFDANGKLVKSFGAGLFVFPHGIHVDRQGNVWVTDGQGRGAQGHQVIKFSPNGQVLLRLGQAGIAGNNPYNFNMPSSVYVAPNGDIFVGDGHGGESNNRIVKFDKNGKYIKEWGTKGSAPGQFDTPHTLAMDSQGRLFVGNRNNNRIDIFDQDGKFIQSWTQFSRPSGIYIRNDMIYVADSESESVSRNHNGWKRGMRVGSVKDGKVIAFIPDPDDVKMGTSAAEGVAVDKDGIIYGAEVGPKRLMRYVKN
jgi:sugar lactone lactonase YvrE